MEDGKEGFFDRSAMALLRSKSILSAQRLRGWSQRRAEWASPCKHPRWGRAEGVTISQASILAGIWRWTRCFCSTKGERAVPLSESGNAYEVLGIARHCSREEIQAAFRALAKATHPDLKPPDTQFSSTASFVRILAAYQILSDPQKRAHYDAHLRLRSDEAKRKQASMSRSVTPVAQQTEATGDADCVEWLRHYRWIVIQVVHHPHLGRGDGLEDRIRGEVHSAIRKAYFGPNVRSEALPCCFEGEERAEPGVLDVLHLVSGRQLLGVVRQVGGIFLPEEEETAIPLPHVAAAAASKSPSRPGSGIDSQFSKSSPRKENDNGDDKGQDNSGAFVDLELHLFGRVVARASRRSAESTGPDVIWVHLAGESHEDGETCSTRSDILLGTIHGIRSTTSSCGVHDAEGKKTHLILQHWTPMVKHMMWYGLGQGPARCECRSRRARLPPSRYWLFEPRCSTHNVGGWYFETFRRKDADVEEDYSRLAQEEMVEEHRLGLLHPAMYIIAAAYKTLDEEAVKTDRRSPGDSFIRWWRKKWRFFS